MQPQLSGNTAYTLPFNMAFVAYNVNFRHPDLGGRYGLNDQLYWQRLAQRARLNCLA